MSQFNGLAVNFTISERAKTAIEELRRAWNEQSVDRASLLSVGWGTWTLNDGRSFDNVVVTFYGDSMYDDVKHGIETVAGLDMIFFITADNYPKFEGRVLDHEKDKSFFLRAPFTGERVRR